MCVCMYECMYVCMYIYKTKNCRHIHEIKQKRFFLWNVLPNNVKITLWGGRLSTCYQIQAFQGFS